MTPRFADYGPPRRVEGGLTARSPRGAIGEQWWSRRFVAVLESFALGTRLTRGRAYARRGQVLSLVVAPGVVTASVQGSQPRPYAVRIGLRPFPELAWAKAEVLLAEQALCSAQLLAGQMPAELEQVLAAAGAQLFPGRLSELAMTCSCPDAAVPCKHLAATLYLLAESFDDDPFRILHWRGRERADLLTRLRQLRGGAGVVVGPRAARPLGAAAALAGTPGTGTPGTGTPSAWEAPPLPVLPGHPQLPADLLLRQLPAAPAALGGASLTEHLRRLYEQMATPPVPGSSSGAAGP